MRGYLRLPALRVMYHYNEVILIFVKRKCSAYLLFEKIPIPALLQYRLHKGNENRRLSAIQGKNT